MDMSVIYFASLNQLILFLLTSNNSNRIGGVMVSVLVSNAIDRVASVICSGSVAMFRGLCEWPEEYCNGPRLMFVLVTPKLLYSWFIFGACENKEGNHFYSE